MNDMRRNDYLRRRRDRRMRQDGRMDYRRNRGSSSGRDYAMGGRDYYSEPDYRDYAYPDRRSPYSMGHSSTQRSREFPRSPQFEVYGVGGMRPMERQDRMDGTYDYSSEDVEKEYEHKLHEWIEKLQSKNRFRQHTKEHILQQAHNMGVRFEEFDKEEFYAIYLMHVSDYPTISNEYNMYIRMAKDWLEDDDIPISPSEKVCKYLYTIVLDED